MYPTSSMTCKIFSGIADSRQVRRGKGIAPPRAEMLKSSRKIRQSRSFISSSGLSDQCRSSLLPRPARRRSSGSAYLSSASVRRFSCIDLHNSGTRVTVPRVGHGQIGHRASTQHNVRVDRDTLVARRIVFRLPVEDELLVRLLA